MVCEKCMAEENQLTLDMMEVVRKFQKEHKITPMHVYGALMSVMLTTSEVLFDEYRRSNIPSFGKPPPAEAGG